MPILQDDDRPAGRNIAMAAPIASCGELNESELAVVTATAKKMQPPPPPPRPQKYRVQHARLAAEQLNQLARDARVDDDLRFGCACKHTVLQLLSSLHDSHFQRCPAELFAFVLSVLQHRLLFCPLSLPACVFIPSNISSQDVSVRACAVHLYRRV